LWKQYRVIHRLIPCRMNLRSRTVLLDFVCLKKCGELHFGQPRTL